MVEDRGHPALESVLETYFQFPSPDSRFIERLGLRLAGGAAQGASRPIQSRRLGRAWARYVVIGLIAALMATLLAIGPERVITAFERWVGYLPGFGVVELSGARALPRPVSHSENGITFSVEQFVASADETLLLVKVTGLEKGQEVSPRTVFIEWPGGNGLRTRADMSGPNYPPLRGRGMSRDQGA